MLNISIITVGNLKEDYLKNAAKEYQKRISRTYKLEIIELPESKLPQNPSKKEIEKALLEEGKAILKKIPKGAFSFALCIEGKGMTSEELTEKLAAISSSGTSNVCFIIGSSFGLSDEVKASSNFLLSMSKMTFPHQLARVMLLEQIYRCGQISIGSKYHK